MAVQGNRCVILSAGPVEDAGRLRGLLRPDDWVIAADGGLRLAQRLGVRPAAVVADFDSYTAELPPDAADEIVRLPVCKDGTDTMAAARLGLERGYASFLLLGCTGGRLDHTMGNIAVLLYLLEQGAEAWLVDEHSGVRMLYPGEFTLPLHKDCRFSLLPYAGRVEGITVQSAAYPLKDAVLQPDDTLGISNEFLEKDVQISFKAGILMVFLAKD